MTDVPSFPIHHIRKRDGRVVPFDRAKIEHAVAKAARAVGNGVAPGWAAGIAARVTDLLIERFGPDSTPEVEQIQDVVEEVLIGAGHPAIAKAYILYREQRSQVRATEHILLDGAALMDDYLKRLDWRVSENSNMNYSLQGLNFYVASSISARYWLNRIYPPEVRQAHTEGAMHIHDLSVLAAYTYYGKEVVIARRAGQLRVCSLEQLYENTPGTEVLLNEVDEAYAKYPDELFVLDQNGWTRAVRLVRKAKHRPMRFIKNRGGRSVIVTDNHPMIVPDGEKEAHELGAGDQTFTADLARLLAGETLFTVQSIDLVAAIRERGPLDYAVYLDGRPLEQADEGLDPGQESGLLHTATSSIPRFLQLTGEFGYFVGFALAEGFLSYDTNRSRVIAITQREQAPLLRANRGLLENGISGVLTHRKDDRWELRVTNPFLRFLFERVFEIKTGSRHKTLPVGILSYNQDFVKGIIAGLLDGDGSLEGSGTQLLLRVAARTLLEQLAVVLELLGFVPRDRAVEGQGSQRVYREREIVQNYPLYGLAFSKTQVDLPADKYQLAAAATKSWHDSERGAWHRLLNNKPVEIPDDVIYDITTESGTLVVNGMWNHNCCGWDLQDLLIRGFGGVPAKVESRPPRHLRSALGQIVNFFYTLQGETAGAQAFSNFDTLLAPFVAYDELDYKGVKQAVQEFVYNINVPTRVGFQTPFTNITMDLVCPETLRDQAVIIGGEARDRTCGEFQREMDLINRAFAEVMLEGDAKSRVFTFPIPTYNITAEFDWENDDLQPLWEMTARYGIPYFANYTNSDMKPEDARSMCCRLRLDNRELRKRGGGLFAANPLTGSVGVVTVNMARLGYLSSTEDGFFARLGNLMDTAQASLEIKRKTLERLTEQGLYPYSRHYLDGIQARSGAYWDNHFSTIGLNGMNEACLNFLGADIGYPDGKAFALRVLDFMLEKLRTYQEETGHLYNLEASPAEGATYRLARADVERYPDIVTAGTREAPFYTNSTHLPVDYTDDLWATLMHQDELQVRYTGGTVLHGFLGERIEDWRQARLLVRRIAENFRLPYYTLTPTFSICPVHGYIPGEHHYCPYDHTPEQLEQLGLTIAYESQPTQVPTVAG